MTSSILITCATMVFATETESPYMPPDCSINSLYLYGKLNKKNFTLAQLELEAAAYDHRNGLSMQDIIKIARKFDIKLQGETLALVDTPLTSPVIAFLRLSPTEGHFVVLRPVGTTGKMVQILDSPHAARIVDYQELLSSPYWTGLVLGPEHAIANFNVLFVCAITFIILYYRRDMIFSAISHLRRRFIVSN